MNAAAGFRRLSALCLRLRIRFKNPKRVTAYHAVLIVDLMLANVPIDYICNIVQLSKNEVQKLFNDIRNSLMFPHTNITKLDEEWLSERSNWMDQVRFGEQINTSTWSDSDKYILNAYRSYIRIKHEIIQKPLALAAEGFYWFNGDANSTAQKFRVPVADVKEYIRRAHDIYLNYNP